MCGGLWSMSSRSRSQMPAGCQRTPTTRPLSSSTRVWLNVAPTCGAASFERRQRGAQEVGVPAVVAVEEGDERGRRRGEPDVARPPRAAVLRVDQPQARVARGALGDDRRRVVGGPVVHDDVLDPALRLAQHRVHRLPDPGPDGVRGRDDGDQRCVVHHPSRPVKSTICRDRGDGERPNQATTLRTMSLTARIVIGRRLGFLPPRLYAIGLHLLFQEELSTLRDHGDTPRWRQPRTWVSSPRSVHSNG